MLETASSWKGAPAYQLDGGDDGEDPNDRKRPWKEKEIGTVDVPDDDDEEEGVGNMSAWDGQGDWLDIRLGSHETYKGLYV